MIIENNRVFWFRSVNFGDQLSAYIYKKITGNDAVYTECDAQENKYVLTGSLLSAPLKNCKILGAGFVDSLNEWSGENCDIKMVRGHKSFRKIKNIDCFIGEPTHVMPFLYNPDIEGFYDIGFIPHIEDFELVLNRYKDDFLKGHALLIDFNQRMMDLDQYIEKTVERIKLCKHIVSSSLHGCIIANVYGIPFTWVKFSNKLIGDGFKFQDYIESVGLKAEYVDLRSENNNITFTDLISKSQYSENTFRNKLTYDFLRGELL